MRDSWWVDGPRLEHRERWGYPFESKKLQNRIGE